MRQEYVFVQDPLIVWHINRWSGGYDGSESTAKALWKYGGSKGPMGICPCKKYFEDLHSLLHSVMKLFQTRLCCAAVRAQPCQGLCVTGAWVCTGPAEINCSSCRWQITLQDQGTACQIYRPISFNLIFVSFLCWPPAELFYLFPKPSFLAQYKKIW